jgi:hypothetical protein
MKTKQTRKVPVVSFAIPPSTSFSEVAKSDSFKYAVFTETLIVLSMLFIRRKK